MKINAASFRPVTFNGLHLHLRKTICLLFHLPTFLMGFVMTVHYGNTVPCPKDKRAEARENGQAGKMDRFLILDDHSPMTVISGQNTLKFCQSEAQDLCESRDDRPGLPVPNSPYDLCGR